MYRGLLFQLYIRIFKSVPLIENTVLPQAVPVETLLFQHTYTQYHCFAGLMRALSAILTMAGLLSSAFHGSSTLRKSIVT